MTPGPLTPERRRRIMSAATLQLEAMLQRLGCANPLVTVRLTDTDPAPEPGSYIDIAVAARIRLSDSTTP
jgi:hypothetical protein